MIAIPTKEKSLEKKTAVIPTREHKTIKGNVNCHADEGGIHLFYRIAIPTQENRNPMKMPAVMPTKEAYIFFTGLQFRRRRNLQSRRTFTELIKKKPLFN